VLISCGILLVGLTSMSAMLAAAGFRLTQANLEDRAAVAATNALAEVRNRGLTTASALDEENKNKVLILGDVMLALTDYGAASAGQSPWFAEPSPSAKARCGSPRTFQLEDDLMYESGQLAGPLSNAFTMLGSTSTFSVRRLRPGVVWGATLACLPIATNGAAESVAEAIEGSTAELAVAIFKRNKGPTSMQSVTLTKANDGLSYEYIADPGSPEPPLRACSWVLAIPFASSAKPRWFRVRASWTMEPLSDNLPRIILDHQEEFEKLTASTGPNSTAKVIVFDGLVRLDKHIVILD